VPIRYEEKESRVDQKGARIKEEMKREEIQLAKN
jgi:hypothetical protein